jgi:hypothetical protein
MPPPSTAFTLISGSDYYYALFRRTELTNLRKDSEAISPCNAVRLWLTHVGGLSARKEAAAIATAAGGHVVQPVPQASGRWGRQLIPIRFVHARARLHHRPCHCSKACFGIYWSWAIAFDLMPSMVAKRPLEAHFQRRDQPEVTGSEIRRVRWLGIKTEACGGCIQQCHCRAQTGCSL